MGAALHREANSICLVQVVGTTLLKLAHRTDRYRDAVLHMSEQPHVLRAISSAQGASRLRDESRQASTEFKRFSRLSVSNTSQPGISGNIDATARTQGFEDLSNTFKPDWKPLAVSSRIPTRVTAKVDDGVGGDAVLESPIWLNALDDADRIVRYTRDGHELEY